MTATDDRFWAKVVPAPFGECWLWNAAGLTPSSSGYGRFRDENGERVRAHRWAYESLIGPIPEGLELDHLCRVRRCVNPWHCEPVPGRVNSQRGAAVRPPRTHCIKGHDLAETGVIRNDGHRDRLKCVTCVRQYDREWHMRKVARPLADVAQLPARLDMPEQLILVPA